MLMISLCVILKFVVAESQIHTQKYGRRPYGVGLLVAGYDVSGSWDLQSVVIALSIAWWCAFARNIALG
jgi:20S proteasome alpha/beta subunit